MRKILLYITAWILIPLNWPGMFIFWLFDKIGDFFSEASELSYKIKGKYK